MKKSELYAALRTEIHQHDFSTYVDEPPSVAEGGRGVVVPGCPTCKKRIGTLPQFLMFCLCCWISCPQNKGDARIRYAVALTLRRSIQRSQSNLSIMYFGRFPVPGRMMYGIDPSPIMSYIMPTESPTYTTDCLGVRSRFSGEIGTVLKRC
jgi:hypothetical protein